MQSWLENESQIFWKFVEVELCLTQKRTEQNPSTHFWYEQASDTTMYIVLMSQINWSHSKFSSVFSFLFLITKCILNKKKYTSLTIVKPSEKSYCHEKASQSISHKNRKNEYTAMTRFEIKWNHKIEFLF